VYVCGKQADLKSTGENVVVGGSNSWAYTSFVNYDFFPSDSFPILVSCSERGWASERARERDETARENRKRRGEGGSQRKGGMEKESACARERERERECERERNRGREREREREREGGRETDIECV